MTDDGQRPRRNFTSSLAPWRAGGLARGLAGRWHLPHPDEITNIHGEASADALEPLEQGLRVLVWNVFKGKRASWGQEFRSLARQHDVILAQELYFEPRTHDLLRESALQWTTATSFYYARRGGIGTGLGTAARAVTRRMHAMLTPGREPVTGTPKLALLTSYMFGEVELLVANVHAINFAGFTNFDEQLRRLELALAGHEGPLLVAGDFNTWTTRRLRRLDALACTTGLEPVAFASDRRANVLDHALVRGLRASDGQVVDSRASDHAALSFMIDLDR
jgi:endonuclease/exonuclease/phosphatase (EEP) superfamily protein YafD